jgi:hypothetical protein
VISRVGYGEIQGRLTGMTNLIAVWGKKADSIGIKVLVNPFKNQTLLDYFSANSESNGHRQLQWLSLQEYQNAFFVVERSTDRIHFDSIALVKGSGTKNSHSAYGYTDESKETAPIYYRLKLVDSLGKESYSRIIAVSVNTITSPLPVKLLAFTGQLVQNKITLKWTTVSEVNNKQFVIEAGDDGMVFTEIGVVNGKGNSSVPVSYSFDDSRPLTNGKHYYRLKQYDFDGNFVYSSVVLVQVNEEGIYSISLYPNPAQKRILVNFSQPLVNNLQLELIDIHGRRLLSKTLTVNSTLIPIDLPLLTAGMYLITISNERGEKLLTNKLIIQQ